MGAEVVFRRYQDGDEKGIVQLLELVFDGWPHFDLQCGPLDHWRWKYLDSPFAAGAIRVAEHADKIVGCVHAVDCNVKLGSQTLLCGLTADQAMHPDFRGLGLSRKMNRVGPRSKRAMSYFVSVSEIQVARYSKAGLRFPGILAFVRIHDVDRQLRAMAPQKPGLMKLGFLGAKLLNDAINALPRRATGDADLEPREIRCFDERIDDFWSEVAADHDFIVERRRDYLNWRYNDPRSGGYVVKQVEERGRVVGYSVLKINRYVSDYPIGFICDLLALPGRNDVVDALVADAVRGCDEEGINLMCCAVPRRHPYGRVLGRHRFLNSGQQLPLFFGRRQHEINDRIRRIRPGRLHFSFGDLDTLPVGMPEHR